MAGEPDAETAGGDVEDLDAADSAAVIEAEGVAAAVLVAQRVAVLDGELAAGLQELQLVAGDDQHEPTLFSLDPGCKTGPALRPSP